MGILWLSQHPPLEIQTEALQARFGEVEIVRDVNPFSSAEEIAERYKGGNYDDMVVVAPLSVIS